MSDQHNDKPQQKPVGEEGEVPRTRDDSDDDTNPWDKKEQK